VVTIIVLLLGLAFGVYKYRSRDEGVYRIDDAKNYFTPGVGANGGTMTVGGGSNGGYEVCNSKPMVHLDGIGTTGSNGDRSSRSRSRSRSSSGSVQGGGVRTKRKENREWYV
jgi:hypothetical protein